MTASLTRHFINRCFQICKLISCMEIVIPSLCIPTSSLSELIPKINGYSVLIRKYPESKSFDFFFFLNAEMTPEPVCFFNIITGLFFLLCLPSNLLPQPLPSLALWLPPLLLHQPPFLPIYSNAACGKSNASPPGVKSNTS